MFKFKFRKKAAKAEKPKVKRVRAAKVGQWDYRREGWYLALRQSEGVAKAEGYAAERKRQGLTGQ
jgi:hypothetical protein